MYKTVYTTHWVNDEWREYASHSGSNISTCIAQAPRVEMDHIRHFNIDSHTNDPLSQKHTKAIIQAVITYKFHGNVAKLFYV